MKIIDVAAIPIAASNVGIAADGEFCITRSVDWPPPSCTLKVGSFCPGGAALLR